MQSSRFRFLSLILMIASGAFVAHAQSSVNSSDWETLRPEGEEFSILMPKGSTFESGKEPYHKMELNSRVYLSRSPSGPVFGIVSLSGIKSNPAMYTEMQRVNSYVDAFKQIFSARVKEKDAVARLTLVGDKKLQGHLGREYKLTLGTLSGTANVFATRRRFYAIVYLNSKKENPLKDEFLSSFTLPDKVADAPQVATQNPPADAAQPPAPKAGAEGEVEAAPNIEAKPGLVDSAGVEQKKRAPISGGVLNGKAITLPKPDYPPDARAAGAAGTVVVQVTIDEMGMVAAAKAVSGHPLLHQASVNAALQSRFSPTALLGEPVKVTGVITYNFVLNPEKQN